MLEPWCWNRAMATRILILSQVSGVYREFFKNFLGLWSLIRPIALRQSSCDPSRSGRSRDRLSAAIDQRKCQGSIVSARILKNFYSNPSIFYATCTHCIISVGKLIRVRLRGSIQTWTVVAWLIRADGLADGLTESLGFFNGKMLYEISNFLGLMQAGSTWISYCSPQNIGHRKSTLAWTMGSAKAELVKKFFRSMPVFAREAS